MSLTTSRTNLYLLLVNLDNEFDLEGVGRSSFISALVRSKPLSWVQYSTSYSSGTWYKRVCVVLTCSVKCTGVLNIDGTTNVKNALKFDTAHNTVRTVPWLGGRSTIAEVGVQSWASPCVISGGQNIARTGFSPGTETFPSLYHSIAFLHLSQMPLQSYHLTVSLNNSVKKL